MKIISFVDFNLGKLENPNYFPLQLFRQIQFDEAAIKKLGLKEFPARLIIAKNEECHYYIGLTQKDNREQAWPVFNWFYKDDLGVNESDKIAIIPFDSTAPGEFIKSLDVTLTDRFSTVWDMCGHQVRVYEMEVL